MRRAIAAALIVGLSTSACTSEPVESDSGAAAPSRTTAGPTSASPAARLSAGIDEKFARELRRTLSAPPLPAFSIPTKVLSGAASQRISEDLDVSPGLYQGIAVLDARCAQAGEATAPDIGAPVSGAAQHYEDEMVSVTVGNNGTGVYDTADLHIAVLADGAGVYDDGQTRLSVAADGSGTYDNGELRYAVRADGSGTFSDGDTRVWVNPDGAGGYEDDSMRLSWKAAGEIFGDGDPARVAAVQAVLADGLPRYGPVPRVELVEPTGTICGTVIRLDANVAFDIDRAEVRPEGDAVLQRVAALLAELGSPRARINGHTDTVGAESYNLDLSERRAEAVRDQLVGFGLSPDSLTTEGLGETQPLRPETGPNGAADPAARQINRRVEIILLD